jgi:hypothetical protein
LRLEDIAMFAQVMWFSAFVVGINVGWEPLPEGGMVYIIQLDPQTLEALKSGEPILSDVPPRAGDVRTYKIIMGSDKPPRIDPPVASAEKPLPHTFWPDQREKPLTANSASFVEPAQKDGKPSAASDKGNAEKTESSKPWVPLILAAVFLFASLGGNVYLAWIFADLRRRYQLLITSQNQHGEE